MFKKAIEGYTDILKNNRYNPAIKGSIMLHKGYCLALHGKISDAKKIYLTIIDLFHGDSAAITASVLLSYLNYSTIEKDKLLNSAVSQIDKAEKLYNLLIFKESLKIIQILEKNPQYKNTPRFLILRALCYNSVGNPEKASNIFLDLIERNPSSKYARFANRRLFLIGIRAGDDSFIKTVKRLNIYLKDPILENMINVEKFSSADTDNLSENVSIRLPSGRLKKIENKLAVKEKSFYGKSVIVKTKGGDTLIGEVIEDTDRMITLQTKIGKIKIEKAEINSIREK